MIEMIDPIFHDTLRRELGIESKSYLKAERFISESKQRAEDSLLRIQKQAESEKRREKFYTSHPHPRPK